MMTNSRELLFEVSLIQSSESPDGKVIVKPAEDGIKALKAKIKIIFKRYRLAPLGLLINELNPITRHSAGLF
jgi:hypothetical protein